MNKKWYEMYQLAQAFYEEHHHLKIPIDYKVDNKCLGSWLHRQKDEYRKGHLTERQIELLMAIGFSYTPRIFIMIYVYGIIKKIITF